MYIFCVYQMTITKHEHMFFDYIFVIFEMHVLQKVYDYLQKL